MHLPFTYTAEPPCRLLSIALLQNLTIAAEEGSMEGEDEDEDKDEGEKGH